MSGTIMVFLLAEKPSSWGPDEFRIQFPFWSKDLFPSTKKAYQAIYSKIKPE